MIEDIGSAVKGFKPGDAVIADPNVFCENCHFCKQNQQIHCENIEVIGNTRNGAFAEYVTVPERCVFHADGIDFIEGAMAEPLACVINAHNKAAIPVGANVLICGAGAIGLMHVLMSKRRGAGRIVVIDLKPSQLEMAKELGADDVLISDANIAATLKNRYPRGFEFVIEATGVPKVAQTAIPLLANTGTYIAFGACPVNSAITINPFDLYYRDLRLIGSYALQKTMPQAIAMLKGGINLKPLVGRTVSLTEMPEAFADFCAGRAVNKTIVTFD